MEGSMSKLDKAINQIITHPNYNRLVECFSAHRWNVLASPAKVRVLQTLENEVAKMTNRSPKTITSDKFALSVLEVGKDEINLKTRDLENDTSPYIFLREYLLEFKLQEQNAILKNNNRDESAQEDEFALWKKNSRISLIDSELKCLLPKSDPDYHYQPLLVSANSFATETVEKTIKTVYERFSLDKYIERFLESGRKNFNNLGSLSDKQLMSYFNEYTWMSLEQAERLQVIEEIENRETGGNKREKINMNYYGFISSVAYNVPIHLETYYTQTFEKEAKYIIDSEKQETPSTLVKALLRYLARYNPTWKGYKNGLYRDIFNSYDEEEHVRNPLLSKLNIADIYFFKYMYDKLTKAEDILRGDPLFNQLEWDKVLTKYDYKRFIKDVEHLLDKSKEELIIDNDNDIYKTINTR